MRIIKGGLLNNKKVTCSRCGCVYEYDMQDLHEELIQPHTIDINSQSFWSDASVYVRCPECGMKHYIVSNNEVQVTREEKQCLS